jgi:hydroxymethylglutaryl-CoA reductase (NADPH)
MDDVAVTKGKHQSWIAFTAKPFGGLTLDVSDTIRSEEMVGGIPRDSENNYSEDPTRIRHEYTEETAGAVLEHAGQYSTDPEVTEGNVENFVGVARMPIGVAGPVKVNGEYADGEYPMPIATTEETFVASYSRGTKAINLPGGAKRPSSTPT